MGTMGTNQMEPDATVFIIESADSSPERATEIFRSRGYRVRAFESQGAFLNEVNPHISGCVVVDDRIGGLAGLDLLEALRRREQRLPAIIVTDGEDLEFAVSAMKLGAADVVKRPFSAGILVEKVENALEDSRRLRADELATSTIKRRMARLTPRELEVMELIASGLANKSIARRLGIGHRTVEVHRAHLMEKLQAASSAELIMMVFLTRGVSVALHTWAASEFGVGWRYMLEPAENSLVRAD